jgi:ATP-dependent DNA helicase PIF1
MGVGEIIAAFPKTDQMQKMSDKKSKNETGDKMPPQAWQEILARKGLGKRRESRKYLAIERPDVTFSNESKHVLDLFEHTRRNIFLTGRAGTGKSTLLKVFRATTKKSIVALAYTGVAAVNIQGQTIHSFFKFGPSITEGRVRKLRGKEANLYRKLDTIVIDEISMVRADFFDCIEKFLRLNGPFPGRAFGGVQMILIGDPYQLPPIVDDEEEEIFKKHYRSRFFFDAKSYDNSQFEKIELTHVYRQSDRDFIEILDAMRLCETTDAHIAKINERFLGSNPELSDDFRISLVTTNAMANNINGARLARLPGSAKTYRGAVDGGLKEKNFPTEHELILKEGAQVMLLNNDPKKRWINGDLAKVVRLDESSVRVLFEDKTFDDIGFYKWETVRFVYDEKENKVESEVVGSFTQIPLRLAWAVTIHKGQGKTFDGAIIDFGTGTFSSGQAYVALSRCRSLRGLTLRSPLKHHHIFIDPRISEFMRHGG